MPRLNKPSRKCNARSASCLVERFAATGERVGAHSRFGCEVTQSSSKEKESGRGSRRCTNMIAGFSDGGFLVNQARVFMIGVFCFPLPCEAPAIVRMLNTNHAVIPQLNG